MDTGNMAFNGDTHDTIDFWFAIRDLSYFRGKLSPPLRPLGLGLWIRLDGPHRLLYVLSKAISWEIRRGICAHL